MYATCKYWRIKKYRSLDFTFTFHFHSLEKEMATHCSVLAWRIPGMGEPGRLQSMGSQRAGQDWATSIHPSWGSGKGKSTDSNQTLTLLHGSCVTVLSWWLSNKGSSCKADLKGNVGSILGSERSLGGGNGNLLQNSCQENPMDRGAWLATVHGVAESQTRLSDWAQYKHSTAQWDK